jgi:hypothetical protein
MFVHVPSAWLRMAGYALLAGWAPRCWYGVIRWRR